MSLLWLDAKYISLLSFRLRNFKKKSSNNWNFSCPVCGDSKSNKSKARGYVYPQKGKLLFHCHNCNVTMDVPRFVKYIDSSMYDEYIKEKLTAEPQTREETDLEKFVNKMKPPKFQSKSALKDLKKISQFKPDSPIKAFVANRLIPPKFHFKLYFCKEFKHWVNLSVPGKFDEESLKTDEPRLIIPFLDSEGNMYGFQGRSFKKNALVRYITIIIDDTKPKLFGLDTVDITKTIYVVEGPIDSMFLPNCIASCGSDLTSNLPVVTSDQSKFVVVYDNEPRNREIVKKIEKAIDNNYTVCLWPEHVKQKDINDMVLDGMSSDKIVDVINENSYKGLEAKLKLAVWRKCVD